MTSRQTVNSRYACCVCGRGVGLYSSGRYFVHNGPDGRECDGSNEDVPDGAPAV